MKIECTQKDWDELVDKGTKRYISTKNRFHVEEAINQVSQTLNDIDALLETYIDGREHLSEDELWGYLDGIKQVLALRVKMLWDAHRQREHIDGYGTLQEVMAATYPDEEDCCLPAKIKTSTKKGKKK